jgi:hypothetical protein
MLLQIGQHTFLQDRGNGIAVLLGDGWPIGLAAEIWYDRKRIKTIATFRGKRRIRGGWTVCDF